MGTEAQTNHHSFSPPHVTQTHTLLLFLFHGKGGGVQHLRDMVNVHSGGQRRFEHLTAHVVRLRVAHRLCV